MMALAAFPVSTKLVGPFVWTIGAVLDMMAPVVELNAPATVANRRCVHYAPAAREIQGQNITPAALCAAPPSCRSSPARGPQPSVACTGA